MSDIDFSLLNTDYRDMKKYILVHDIESGIVIFGTKKTVQTFVQLPYKFVDGTFRITIQKWRILSAWNLSDL